MDERDIFEEVRDTERMAIPRIWKWFVALLAIEYEGEMSTEYATLNYVTCDDLNGMENAGYITRIVDADAGTDIIYVADTSLI